MLQLKHARENISEDSPELFGVWNVNECRQFLELFGIQEIAGEGENTVLSVSSRFADEKVEKALKCFDAFKG